MYPLQLDVKVLSCPIPIYLLPKKNETELTKLTKGRISYGFGCLRDFGNYFRILDSVYHYIPECLSLYSICVNYIRLLPFQDQMTQYKKLFIAGLNLQSKKITKD